MDVSVITTLYNYSQYIEQCIVSFINQLHDGLKAEMIIVDDCSTDNPFSVIKRWLTDGEDMLNIKYIKLDKNMGYSHAKNVGIKEAKGKYLVMLDADDSLYGEYSIINRLNKIEQGYDLVHGPVYDLINGKFSSCLFSPLWRQWINSKKDTTCYKYIHAQGVMLKRDIHKEIGLYDETLRCKSDREMWGRIMNHNYKIGWINEPVAVYRSHPKQMHKSKEKLLINHRLQKEVLELIEKRKTDLSGLWMLK